jgi:hypothetical protein
MKTATVVFVTAILLAGGMVVSASDSRTYTKGIETVWDEAVKATRDADLEVSDSNRSEHWFRMETPKKTLKRTVHFEVKLTQSGNNTVVTVRSVDDEGSKKSIKTINKYFDALGSRMD